MVNDILIKKQYNYTTIKAKKNLAVVKLQGLKNKSVFINLEKLYANKHYC